jgi:(2Fe-2S) ferredoxin
MWERIFFVCQNHREGRAACQNAGSEAILHTLKKHLKAHPELKPGVRVTSSGCLDLCDFGPVIAVFPEGTVYSGVKESDCPALIAHLEGGARVEALVDSPERREALLRVQVEKLA